MSIRAIRGDCGGLAFDLPNEDDAFDLWRQRQVDEAVVVELRRRCKSCGSDSCGIRCRFADPAIANACTYHKGRQCDCGKRGSGICLDAA